MVKIENGELSVFVKFLDTKKNLSVQVHPSDEYAREYECDNVKTEIWYVIHVDAYIIFGFQDDVTEEILRKVVGTGTLDKFQFTETTHILSWWKQYTGLEKVFL